ncbi:hypothetical protein ABPG75_000328 [Micractinium tetrahymenae]
MSEGGAPPERVEEPEERRGDDERRDERRRDGGKEEKSRRRSRSRSRERKSSRRDRSKSRERRRRSRSRDRERDKDRERRRRSRSRDRGDRDRRRRSRSRSRDRYRRRPSPEGGYSYGGRPRREIDPTVNFHDPFAKLRSANQVTDPAEIARQMQEQQLRARQLVLQQQALSAVAAASKTQREVYVGNLTAGLVTADMLRQLFNSTMAAAFPDMAKEGIDPVVNVSVHTEGKYAFVELRTPEMATASLQLNGQVQLLGATLSIGRPSGYVDPGKAAAAAVVAAEALAKFQAESAHLRKQSGLVSEETLKAEDTCYLQVDGMITAEVLADEGEYNEVLADIHDECSKYGTVLRVVVPRPPVPDQAAQLMGSGVYGKAFVQFLDVEGARKAREAVSGRMFAGSTVEATFMQPQQFMDAIVPPPMPEAADPLAAAAAAVADPLAALAAAAAAPVPMPEPAAV